MPSSPFMFSRGVWSHQLPLRQRPLMRAPPLRPHCEGVHHRGAGRRIWWKSLWRPTWSLWTWQVCSYWNLSWQHCFQNSQTAQKHLLQWSAVCWHDTYIVAPSCLCSWLLLHTYISIAPLDSPAGTYGDALGRLCISKLMNMHQALHTKAGVATITNVLSGSLFIAFSACTWTFAPHKPDLLFI